MAFALLQSLCLLLLLLTISAKAQSNTNISLATSLTAGNDDTYWGSPAGDFAFGFQQIGNDGYLLSIWFNNIPEKTIVWSANRDTLAQKGSKVDLTTDGRLVLSDPQGGQMWSVDSAINEAAYAAMLDTGNFVLARQDSVNLWESFDEPTDTILPTQTFNQDSQLISRYTETNYSQGRFKFILQNDGNLVMYTLNFPLDTHNSAYWSTQTSIGSGFQVIFNQSGYIYLIAKNGTILNMVSSNPVSVQEYYQRAVVGYDGVFRQYVYPKRNGMPSGWRTWFFMPSNICLRIGADTGSGACGFNSYCSMGDDQNPSCRCPPGYAFLDPNDERKGCMQEFLSQKCDESSQETNAFYFAELPNTDWPLSDYEHFEPVNEDWCRGACLTDCYCAAAIFRNQNCWKKRIPLSNGRLNQSIGGKALIKVRKYDTTSSIASKNKDQTTLVLVGSVLLGGSVIVLLGAAFLFIFRKRNTKRFEPYKVMQDTNSRSFSYEELEDATSGFKEVLGRGTYGTVYKGVLALDNGRPIAVKKLEKMVGEGELEFKAEVNTIGATNHKNLVHLIGYCNEGQHRLLVYEFMSNGSLANFLFGPTRPNWYKRLNFALGIARGLLYLHEECSSQIIHCDIKPQNILIDDSLTTKISDFGLAKLLKKDQSQTMTAIRGTKGYVAPEWFRSLPITAKVDVYSFGVLLLELVCCRKSFEQDLENEDQMILADWACDCYKERKLHMLVENDEEAMDDLERVKKFLMIAIWCTQEDPSQRPTMKKVTQMLEGAVDVSLPPEPTSFLHATKSSTLPSFLSS
ncbi:G-type lectin S-receptor-like serine/threonine-protein kinase LECRK3 [Tripterygium wilfordii]|uniref:G-type lectin S-receptor-like serine/threonine-protein kinase LECRK3 n=1 Tax=Tripterygium wilfordii TaxID=458696 RepID=UPI0018F860E4|nr:G-type lectin S-receptor-like serine/threonine-protein kinase LECRK3 [Tripterygium wilfordii]